MIKEVVLDDLNDDFFELCYEGYLYHYENRKDIFKKNNIDSLKKHILDQIKNDGLKILILEEKNKLIGYLSYKIKEKTTKSIWIDEFIISKNYRNKGYGTKLIKKIIEISKKENASRIELNCWSFNKNAINFYDKFNFKEQRIIYELEI